MEPEGSLPHSQVPATCPYPEPARSSPYPTSHFLKIHLNIIFPSTPWTPKCSHSGFPAKILYTPLLSPIRATCPAHLILLYLITRTILGGEYKSLSSLVCNFLQSPVTSSLLGPIFSLVPYSQTPSAYVPLCERPSFTHIQNCPICIL